MSPSLLNSLGKNSDEIFPSEGPEASLFHVPIAGAAVMLGAYPSAIDVLAAQGGVERCKGLSDGPVNLLVNHMAARGTSHLPLGLFDKEGLRGPHQDGTCFDGDGFNVACNKCVVCCGGDNGIHI